MLKQRNHNFPKTQTNPFYGQQVDFIKTEGFYYKM
jgi:hypothetical protein